MTLGRTQRSGIPVSPGIAIGPAYVPPATTATAGTAADDDDGPATPDGRAPGSPDDEDEAPEDGS